MAFPSKSQMSFCKSTRTWTLQFVLPYPFPSFTLSSSLLVLSQQLSKYSIKPLCLLFSLLVFSKPVVCTSNFLIPWSRHQKSTVSVRSMLAIIWNWKPNHYLTPFFPMHIYYQLTDYDSFLIYFMCHLLLSWKECKVCEAMKFHKVSMILNTKNMYTVDNWSKKKAGENTGVVRFKDSAHQLLFLTH